MLKIAIPLAGRKNTQLPDNGELKYLLRSLDKNLKIDFQVKLYARELPGWIDENKIDYQIVKKFYPQKARKYHGKKDYENYFDVLKKLWLMSQDPWTGENFLYIYDDLLLIKAVTRISQLNKKVALMHYKENKVGYDRRLGKWDKTVMRAFDLLGEIARPLYDYETHVPRYFNKDKLNWMFKRFPIEEEVIPYAPSTLYFNLFYDKPDDRLYRGSGSVKAGFYGDRTVNSAHLCSYPSRRMDQIESAVKGKMWVNYNNQGLKPKKSALQDWIEKNFPKKSRFER